MHAGGVPASGRTTWLLQRVTDVAARLCPARPDSCVVCIAATDGQTTQLRLWLQERHPATNVRWVECITWRTLLRRLVGGDTVPSDQRQAHEMALLARRDAVPQGLAALRPVALALDNSEQFNPQPDAAAWLVHMAELLQVPVFTTRYGPPPAPFPPTLLFMENRRQTHGVRCLLHVLWWVGYQAQLERRQQRRGGERGGQQPPALSSSARGEGDGVVLLPPPLVPDDGVSIVVLPVVTSELDAQHVARDLRPWLTANTTIVVAPGCRDAGLVMTQLVAHHGVAALGWARPWPLPGSVGVVSMHQAHAIELPGDVVVVCDSQISADDLLQCCTRGTGRLTLAVLGPQMPAPLCMGNGLAGQCLQPIVVDNVYVLWDDKGTQPPAKRGATARPDDDSSSVLPTAVSELATYLASPHASIEAALANAAHRLEWRAPPAVHSVRAPRTPLLTPPPFIQRYGLHALIGHAAELVVAHEQAWRWDGAAPPPPSAPTAFVAAIVCSDAGFLAGWNRHASYLRDMATTDAPGWRRRFQPTRAYGGDEIVATMATQLAGHPPPHILLPPSLMLYVSIVRTALQLYLRPRPVDAIRTAALRVSSGEDTLSYERMYYVLGAATLAVMMAHNRVEYAATALHMTCDHTAWAEAQALPPPGGRTIRDTPPLFFYELAERAKDALQAMRIAELSPQTTVRRDSYHGAVDFVATCYPQPRPSDVLPANFGQLMVSPERVVIEIKACSQQSHRPAWAVQAAIYAHGLDLRTAYVLNLLSGELLCLRFGDNL
jgi:hypothetical protein